MKSIAMALMRAFAISALLLLTTLCSGQELKTVAECRAYRDAWQTSTQNDSERLPVKELLHRADQMKACGKEIDSNPFKSGMTQDEALNVAIATAGYAILASLYYQEAFTRAAWFIHGKHLTDEFITSDSSGGGTQRRKSKDEK
jgi:hypothetical protein